MKVLLVEDNPGDARLLDLMLQEALPAYSLSHADSLSQAIKLIRDDRFDVILLDLSLPDASGHQTFWQLHAIAIAIPIIVMTGLDY